MSLYYFGEAGPEVGHRRRRKDDRHQHHHQQRRDFRTDRPLEPLRVVDDRRRLAGLDHLPHLAHQAVGLAGGPYRLTHAATPWLFGLVTGAGVRPAANSRPRRSASNWGSMTSPAA